MVLECIEISKTHSARGRMVPALEAVSFSVNEGDFVCLVGPSGCGKTTLLKILAGLIPPTTGRVRFAAPAAPGGLPSAMVFQEHGLFPWMRVLENAAFGLEMLGVPARDREARAGNALAEMGLGDFSTLFPHELSMGMRQRVAIARAFLTGAPLLLMDEPFSALDAQSKLVLQEELLRLWSDRRTSVVYVTHDIEEAVLLGDRVLVMSARPGRLVEEIAVPLARPRNLRDRDQPPVRKIAWHIWERLEADVRESLHLRP